MGPSGPDTFFFWLCWFFVAAYQIFIAEGNSFSLVAACGLSCPRVCGILGTRDQISVPCIGRWILNHWTTREVPLISFR